jgi:hypothetical protein
MNKFTTESDFVDSYLNNFIIASQNVKDQLKQNARIFASCVNLNKTINAVADCAAKRDEVNSFLDSNHEAKNLKEKTLGSCTDRLLKAHQLFYSINHEKSAANYVLLQSSLKQAEAGLTECLNNH